MKAPPALQLLVVLTDYLIQRLTAHQARIIHAVRTYDACHSIVAIHIRESLQILRGVLPLVVAVHVAHVGLVHCGCAQA